ncbi:MAG TPA: methyltransferase domain-containing protein [Candidatus Acidoferrum sp.]|nr:methyltransferase domain-containing protein [Candidatus Acidoferrum sp.]
MTGELPEMESTKQLVELVSAIYEPGMEVLDVGCAAGHYYHGLRRIDPDIRYHGVDATETYIDFARNHFHRQSHATFEVGDIYALPERFAAKFDIVFCCNVLLHLPSLAAPLRNLLMSAKKFCIIRTLVSDKTHLSKLLYSDTFDAGGEPTEFVFQNTYSYSLLDATIGSLGDYRVEYIDDKFDAQVINREFETYSAIQSAVTQVQNGVQIAGSKVFEWKWIKVTK